MPGRRVNLLGVKDVESLITDPTDEDKVPCWAEIWPSAMGLSRWVWDELEFEDTDLLELGTGLGLPGIVCGLKGARVTFSDFNPSALELVKKNAIRNGLTDFAVFPGDWRDFNLTRQFQWVMGSDVFYDPKLNIYLIKVISKAAASGGNLLLAHPGRPATFAFIDELRHQRQLNEAHRAVIPVTIDDPYFPYYDIYVHHIIFDNV